MILFRVTGDNSYLMSFKLLTPFHSLSLSVSLSHLVGMRGGIREDLVQGFGGNVLESFSYEFRGLKCLFLSRNKSQ